jgi:hypothetical protein
MGFFLKSYDSYLPCIFKYSACRAGFHSTKVDFLAVHSGKIFPIEVKSGAAGSLRSLHLCLQTHPNCPQGIVYSARPYGELPEQRLLFLPIYLAGGDPVARQAGCVHRH